MELSGVEFGPDSALRTPAPRKSLSAGVFTGLFYNGRKEKWVFKQQELQMQGRVALAT